MKKKKITIIAFGMFLIMASMFFVSSAGCCERLPNEGLWCQFVDDISECDQNYGYRSDLQTCDTYVKCHGTCVNENTGQCSQSPELECVESKGTWYQESENLIPDCQKGCCIAGEYAYFLNGVECKNFATTFGFQTEFRPDLTSRSECSALMSATVIGACVISSQLKQACIITTNTECTDNNVQSLSENLGNAAILSGLEVEFNPGLLCTAPGISDCAKSEITECKDKKVYYKDTCGNFANIYDSSKYSNPDYWTWIKKPYEQEICTVSPDGSSSCGNCDTTQNTVCKNKRNSNVGNPEYGDYVCGDLSCEYQGEKYYHTESWCAGTNGALARYIIDEKGVNDLGVNHRFLTDGFTQETSPETIELLENQDNYNTPGSKYFKLICSFGEVMVEECKEYRNSVCTEFIKEDENSLNQAACRYNTWQRCFEMVTKNQCEESTEMCKWIPGYTWDFSIVSELDRKSQQGSCVPLVPPGFDFWKGDSQGIGLCQMATVQENTLYESGIWTDRDSFHEWSKRYLANRCYDKCYAIPRYAEEYEMGPNEEKLYPEEIECSSQPKGIIDKAQDCGLKGNMGCTPYQYLTEFYDESECHLFFPGDSAGKALQDLHLSDRRGQYCHKDGNEEQFLTGPVSGMAYDCTIGFGSEEKDERKERDYPIYLTHKEWLDGITERARSIGDCGYKPNLEGVYSSDETEIITAIFQKLKQDGSVKKNVTANQIIYKGKVNVEDQGLIMESPVESESYSCSEKGGVCTFGGVQNCGGTPLEGQELCPYQGICCVYDENDGEGI